MGPDGLCYGPRYGPLYWDPTGSEFFVAYEHAPETGNYLDHIMRVQLNPDDSAYFGYISDGQSGPCTGEDTIIYWDDRTLLEYTSLLSSGESRQILPEVRLFDSDL